MTNRPKRTIPQGKLKRLADAMGGRGAIAEAIGMSRPAVDRYCIGKGMRAETFAAITQLIADHVDAPALRRKAEAELVPEPPTLEETGGHLLGLLSKALERNSGVEALQAQLTRMENRLMRIEENQRANLHAWGMRFAPMPSEV